MLCLRSGPSTPLGPSFDTSVSKTYQAMIEGSLEVKLPTIWRDEKQSREVEEKLHAAVARSVFSSEKVQNTPWWDHFLKCRCQKIALQHCAAKHICKSKNEKTDGFGPLFEVGM